MEKSQIKLWFGLARPDMAKDYGGPRANGGGLTALQNGFGHFFMLSCNLLLVQMAVARLVRVNFGRCNLLQMARSVRVNFAR